MNVYKIFIKKYIRNLKIKIHNEINNYVLNN